MSGLTRRAVIGGLFTAAVMPRSSYAATRMATAFGTIVSLSIAGRDRERVEASIAAGFAEIRAVEKSMSLFDPASELSRLNRRGGLDRPSAMLREVLELSRQAWRITGGAFDPAVQPLWNAWARARGEGRWPDDRELAHARHLAGMAGIESGAQGIALGVAGRMLTLNGIAQGYAADRVAGVMRAHGVDSAVIDTGEIGSAGLDFAAGPEIAIENPRRPGKAVGSIRPGRRFAATSGDYATSFTADFSAHHIFDPVTGRSPGELASVTVLAPSGAMADGLATGFMVMGRDRSLRLAGELDGVDALLIGKDGGIAVTPGMLRKFNPA